MKNLILCPILLLTVAISYSAQTRGVRQPTGSPATQTAAINKIKELHQQVSTLFDQGKFDEAIALAGRALEISDKALNPDDPFVASCTYVLAAIYRARGDNAHAEPLFVRTLTILEKILGADSPLLYDSLISLAAIHQDNRDYNRAEELFQRALDIKAREVGPKHRDLLVPLGYLATLYQEKGDLDRADQIFKRTQAIIENEVGKDSLEEGEALTKLGEAYVKLGSYARALPLLERALTIYEKVLEPNSPAMGVPLTDLGYAYFQSGDYAHAEPLFERALSIAEKTFGPNDQRTFVILNNLGTLCEAKGDYARAEALLQRALAAEQREPGANQLAILMSLQYLGALYVVRGDLDRAESFLKQSLDIAEKQFEADHERLVMALNDMGELFRRKGDYVRAEPLYQRALGILEKEPRPDPSIMSRLLNNLATLYQYKGDYDRAAELFGRGINFSEKALGPNHPDVAMLLNNLLLLYQWRGDLEKDFSEASIEEMFQRVLTIDEQTFGPDHPKVALTLTNLAGHYQAKGDYSRAEALFQRAIAMIEKAYGGDHYELAFPLESLASTYQERGEYARAKPLFERALAIREKLLSSDHPSIAESLEYLAKLYQAMGRSKDASTMLIRGMNIEQTNLQEVFSVSSEPAMRAYLSTVSGSLDVLLSITAGGQVDNTVDVKTTFAWALRRKGIILDTLVRFREAQFLAQNDPIVANNAARLRSLRQQMSNLPLDRPAGITEEQLQQQLKKLGAEADQLEADLNRKLATQHQEQPTGPVDVAAVRSKLPADGALVEFLRADIFDFKATSQRSHWRPAHYFAFVLSGSVEAPPRMIDLGPAASIDDGIKAVRSSIVEFGEKWKADRSGLVNEVEREKDFRQVGRKLYDQVFAQVRRELGPSIKMVYLAPDDQLNLVPFEALVDGDNKYQIENYRFAYLSSGRDLLRGAPKSTTRGTVVFADPDYDMATALRGQKAKELLAALAKQPNPVGSNAQAVVSQQTSTSYRSMLPVKIGQTTRGRTRSGRWDTLPASAEEAQDVERELKGTDYDPVKEYLKSGALEEIFKQIRSPRVLHISTHGFFPDEAVETETVNRQGPLDPSTGSIAIIGQKLLGRTGNPLLQSGLVLAGANNIGESKTQTAPATEVDDGWVTAEEIAMMNLQGTELVVLSACGSGLGAVSAGEGVYGLRRAFQNAGAQNIVSTLFEVPDKESGQIMRSFYEGLKNKRSKLAALHEAQLQMIAERRKREGAAHPFFWASFVLTGNPN